MVVVRRASGVIETRGPERASTAAEPTAPATEGAPPAEAARGARLPLRLPLRLRPAAPRSALYEEVPEDQSFAEMFEAHAKQEGAGRRKMPRIGEKVTGTIFQLGADTAFVTLERPQSEAMIELRELKDDEGILRFGVGDTVEAHVVEAGAKGVILSRTLTKGSASLAMLAEARAIGHARGGPGPGGEQGRLRGRHRRRARLLPLSQMDLRFVEKPDQFIGEKLRFRVTEVRERNVVLSRRALLEDEQKALAAETRKGLAEGKVLQGKVTGVRDFGVFVDLGGVEGLVPVSELSHVRVGHPSEVVNVGDEVEVEVLRIEAAEPELAGQGEAEGAHHPVHARAARRTRGRRRRGAQGGRPAPGQGGPAAALRRVRGAAPGRGRADPHLGDVRAAHRAPARRGEGGRDGRGRGREDRPGREAHRAAPAWWTAPRWAAASRPRCAAAEPARESAPKPQAAPRPKVGQVVEGKVDRIEPYGVFLVFPGGRGSSRRARPAPSAAPTCKRHFQLGQELKAQILEMDGSGKIRLSLTAAVRAEERAEMEAWQRTQRPSGGGGKGFGTLGDLLKGRKL